MGTPLGVPGEALLRGMTWGHHLGTISGTNLPAVALFPLLEEPSRLSLSLSVPPWWLSLSLSLVWEPVLPPAAAPAH